MSTTVSDATIPALASACRDSFSAFLFALDTDYEQSPYHESLCRDAERIERGEIERIGWSCPPQSGKSHHLARFVAWHWGRNPSSRNMLVSYSWELAKRFARQIRDIVRSDLFRACFPEFQLTPDAQALESMHSTAGGEILIQGVGGSITGRGVSSDGVCVCDDLVSGREAAMSRTQMTNLCEWWDSTLMTRLHPGCGLILCGTRWGTGDIFGHVQGKPDANTWIWRAYPALREGEDGPESIWPSKFPVSHFEALRDSLDDFTWRSMYQCDPLVIADSAIHPDSWKWIEEYQLPAGSSAIKWAFGFDPSATAKQTSDYSACALVGRDREKNIYVHSGIYGKWPWPEAKRRVYEFVMHAPYRGTVAIESVAGFALAYEELKMAFAGQRQCRKLKVSIDKVARSIPFQSAVEAGQVFLVNTPSMVKFAPELIAEAASLGGKGHKFDDAIDCVLMAHQACTKPSSGIAIPTGQGYG